MQYSLAGLQLSPFLRRKRETATLFRFDVVVGLKRYAVSLLYWYKSTNTDAPCAGCCTDCVACHV